MKTSSDKHKNKKVFLSENLLKKIWSFIIRKLAGKLKPFPRIFPKTFSQITLGTRMFSDPNYIFPNNFFKKNLYSKK